MTHKWQSIKSHNLGPGSLESIQDLTGAYENMNGEFMCQFTFTKANDFPKKMDDSVTVNGQDIQLPQP